MEWIKFGPYQQYFSQPNVGVILEMNDVLCTRNLPGIFAGCLLALNDSTQIFSVHPMNVAYFFKVPGTPKLDRPNKKNLTILRMKSFYGSVPVIPDKQWLHSPDCADAMQNFMYVRLRLFSKPPKKSPFTKESDHALFVGPIDEPDGISEDECESPRSVQIEADKLSN